MSQVCDYMAGQQHSRRTDRRYYQAIIPPDVDNQATTPPLHLSGTWILNVTLGGSQIESIPISMQCPEDYVSINGICKKCMDGVGALQCLTTRSSKK